jgi:formylglycine-generating enzyme required for sulfatase activity
MKFVFFILLTLNTVFTFGQTEKSSKIKFRDKEFWMINPPNCQLLYNNVFIDETEIINLNWLEYMFYVKRDSSQEFYKSQLIDSTFHLNIGSFEYLHHPRFRNYPVVGVSYEQAKAYCKWRSNVVNVELKNLKNNYFSELRKTLKNVGLEVYYEFRLPTIEEWEYAAQGGLKFEDYPHGIIEKFYKIKNDDFVSKGEKISEVRKCVESLKEDFKKGMGVFGIQANVKEKYWIKTTNSYVDCTEYGVVPTTEVHEFNSNNFKLFNMTGNVAEMTAEKGIAKGGSFKENYDSFNIKTNFKYESSQNWLGFRCICVVHFRKVAKN